MKNFKIFFTTILGITLFLTSCTDPCKDVTCNDNGTCADDGVCLCDDGYTGTDCATAIPLITGTAVTLSSTFQHPNITLGSEVPIEDQFPTAGPGTATATIGDGVEFENYAYDLFDIDMTENSITFTMVGDASNPYWNNLIGTPINANTYLRYYFALDGTHRITATSTTDQTANAFFSSSNELITVEISEGFSFMTGDSFRVNFE